MNLPSALLQLAFAASSFVSFFVFAHDFLPEKQGEARIWVYAVGAVLASVVLLVLLVRRGHLRVPSHVSFRRFALACLVALASTYLKVAVLLFLVLAVVLSIGLQSPREGTFLASLLAVWLPLWLTPAIASFAVPRLLQRHENDA